MRKIITIIFSLAATCAFAQVAGSRRFDFLNMPTPGRLAGMGGINVSLSDKDPSLFLANPSLAGDTLSGFVTAGYQFYVANVGQALFSYAHDFKKVGQLIFGVQHINYGVLQGFDQKGIETSPFHSGETAVAIAKNHQVGSFRIGATLKGVFSNIAGYHATAVMVDVGGIFKHPQKDITVGLVIKNIGVVLSDFSGTNNASLPFDVQAGISLKPEHMPVRFSLTGYNLLKSDLLSYDKDFYERKPTTVQKIFRHLNLGAEILFHRNFNAMVGYNYLTHEDLKLQTGGGSPGISFGMAIRVKPVELIITRSNYFVGNAGYSFTLSSNIHKLLTRR